MEMLKKGEWYANGTRNIREQERSPKEKSCDEKIGAHRKAENFAEGAAISNYEI
jgi:hypothetical protein